MTLRWGVQAALGAGHLVARRQVDQRPVAARYRQLPATMRQSCATTKQTARPMPTGRSAETTVHLALRVSFQMVKMVVAQGLCSSENSIRLTAVSMADPRGSVPAWLINWVGSSWAYDTMARLRAQVNRSDVVELPMVTQIYADER